MNENIISQLASQMNIKSNVPNKTVAKKCIENPGFLKEIAIHLSDKDLKLSADCAEVMTEVALTNPELITKYFDFLFPLIKSKDTRTRWE